MQIRNLFLVLISGTVYDGILGIETPENTYHVGYTDDIVSVILARGVENARRKLNQVMIRTQIRLEDHGLELAKDKTEVILMIMAHIPLEISMHISDVSLVTCATTFLNILT